MKQKKTTIIIIILSICLAISTIFNIVTIIEKINNKISLTYISMKYNYNDTYVNLKIKTSSAIVLHNSDFAMITNKNPIEANYIESESKGTWYFQRTIDTETTITIMFEDIKPTNFTLLYKGQILEIGKELKFDL